jgi:hypothetical protein
MWLARSSQKYSEKGTKMTHRKFQAANVINNIILLLVFFISLGRQIFKPSFFNIDEEL